MSQRKLNRMTMTRLGFALSLTFALTATACDPDPLYMECDLSSSIVDACEAREGDNFTCVVKEHPTCLEDICASYEDQQAVCTRSCNEDADCGSSPAAICYTDTLLTVTGSDGSQAPLKFCVLQSHIDNATAAN